MAQTLLSTLRSLNRWVALLIGVMLLICAGVVLADILFRRLGSSFGGTDEISGYVMAIATSWGMGYTLLELGHVRIDLLRGRMRDKRPRGFRPLRDDRARRDDHAHCGAVLARTRGFDRQFVACQHAA